MEQLTLIDEAGAQVNAAARAAGHRPTDALTDEQEQAVARRRESLLLSAGAGSGKTAVLVERFVRAVLEDGVAPGRILAITFTERAAGELRERVRERLLQLGERAAARDTEAAFVSTFHGFCARLLRGHPLMVGLDPEFAILDEGLAVGLRGQAFRIALGDFLRSGREEAVDLVAAYGADRVGSIVQGTYAELRSTGQRSPTIPKTASFQRRLLLGDLLPPGSNPATCAESPPTPSPVTAHSLEEQDAADADGGRASVLLGELVEGFGRSYELLKRRRGAVDFDDLELLARDLLEQHESVRAAWSERFELLMVDEFQDTNRRQLAILAALDRDNLFTVGDELQSIYGFRHADVSLFRARRAELAEQGRSIELARNFRSRAPLLDVVNAVFAERLGSSYQPLIATDSTTATADEAREGGRAAAGEVAGEPLVELLLTDRQGWEEDPALALQVAGELPAAPRWRQAEARLLAQRVAELVRSGEAQAGGVAVLLRALGDIEVYERALQERGLLTLATVGGFWGRQQVGDLLAYLRAVANPLDEQALYATLASPLVGCSSDALALIARAARERGTGQVWEAVRAGGKELDDYLPPADLDALARFRARFEAERRVAPLMTISALIERVVDASDYREQVLGMEGGERRLANVHKLLHEARRFEANEGRDLRGFLDHAVRLRDTASVAEPDALVAGTEPDAVRLMSIHAAKGLEFPVVCVADLGRAQNLSVPDLIVDGDRVGLRLLRLDGEGPTPSLDYERLSESLKRAQGEEEDRILYVAMTRARERLLLSGAVDFERWPQERQGAPTISWLGPAIVSDLPAIAQALESPVCDLALNGSREGATVRCRLNAPSTVGAVLRPDPPRQGGGSGTGDADAGMDVSISTERAPLSIQNVDTIAHKGGKTGQPPPTTPLDDISTLSYTALAELERCGYRYYLERVLGLKENRSASPAHSSADGLEARARGTLVHRLLESVDFARAEAPSPQEVASVARELGVRVGRSEREEIAALIAGAVVSPRAASVSGPSPAARIAAAASVHREHPFAFSLGPQEPLITGVIDLLARERDDGFLVLDYKSDRVSSDVDLGALVERDYGVQRLLYALAVLRDGAPTVEIIHWFLERPGDWVGARYSAADSGALEKQLGGRIERARAGMFEVSRHPHRGLCETCPGRAGLCSWGEAETLREASLG